MAQAIVRSNLTDCGKPAAESAREQEATADGDRESDGTRDPVTDRVLRLYRDAGLSTRAIASQLGLARKKVTATLHAAGVELPDRGRGRPRPGARLRDPIDLEERLHELYIKKRLSAREVGDTLGMSERTVRERLAELGIPRRTKGRQNREDRTVVDPAMVERLYVGEKLTADQVGAVLGCSRKVVLRTLHDWGVPVRQGPADDTVPGEERPLLETLYADHLVRAALARHGIPVVATPGPIWERFPVPVRLTPALMADLYEGCGLGVTHIELLTGQPAATVAKRCVRGGIRLRKPGGRCPFLLRVQNR